MASLSDASTPHLLDDRHAYDVPAGWRQGRGAYGGLVIATLVRAIEQRVADPRRAVRTVTAELPGPVDPGAAELVVEILRTGTNMSTARAALSQGGDVKAHAVAILAAARSSGAPLAWMALAPPRAPPWQDLAPLAMSPGGTWPEFAQHFEYRVASGLPAAGGDARTIGWVRAHDPGTPPSAAAFLAAMIDVWWPAVLVRLTAPRPIATIAFTLDVIDDLAGLDPRAPLLYRGTVPVCGDGYFVETRELWSEEGRLLAINHQTFAIIK